MIRRPPRSTLMRSSAASDVYKRQFLCKVQIDGFYVDFFCKALGCLSRRLDRLERTAALGQISADGLNETLSVLLVLGNVRVDVLGAANLELGRRLVLAVLGHLDVLGVLSLRQLEERLNFTDQLGHICV
eukprot:TRINITY_DN75_c0_g3_i1.p1 TRINITY_DN75_c0_g3~~TRINITY_DN75_c0_g3_i1.p1  ORF type:complete len:130 (+),score=25.82 TRINITY_DN75_c0_g3_i1:3-392(+)